MKRFGCMVLTLLLLTLSQAAQAESLPADLEWITNNDEPLFADEEAKRGGTYRLYITSFPLTMRTVGPDSNGSFRSWLQGSNMALLERHPNTREYLPSLASEWAFDQDNKTIYFKLDKRARWSDGTPVTTDDFQFMMTMMRSKNIHAPWYNDYYTNSVAAITVYDKYTMAIHAAEAHNRDELIQYLNLVPRPKHFYRGEIPEDFVKRYNWKPEPTTGPYHVGKVKKGKFITLERTENWWGYGIPYYKYRYNVDRIMLKVVRDNDIALKHFHKGDLDSFPMLFPSIWHNKAKGKLYEDGFIKKAWLFNQTPQGAAGIWLNLNVPLLQNLDIRKGIAYSLNFEKMIEQVLLGDYVRQENFGSGHGKYDNPGVKAPRYNIEKAIEAFVAAGFDKLGPDGIRVNEAGVRLSIELTYLTKMHNPRVVILKEEARKTGLEIELKLIEGATGFKALLEKKFEAGLLSMSSSLIPHYWEYFHSSNAKVQTNNFTGVKNPELDSLIDQYDAEFDSDKKALIAHEIQKIISESYLVIPSYSVPFSRGGFWRWVHLPEEIGTRMSDDILDSYSIEYGLFWVDEEERKATKKALKSGGKFTPVTLIDKRFFQVKPVE